MNENTIKIHKNGENLDRFQRGVEIKNDGRKIRIVGSVMRIEIKPRTYGNDFKFDIILPNGKEFDCTDEHGFIQWAEFMAAMVEAATGSKPKNGNERTVIEVNGIPMKFSDTENGKTATIDATIDPLEEVYEMPKKADTPTPTTTPTVNGSPALPAPTKQNDDWEANFYG